MKKRMQGSMGVYQVKDRRFNTTSHTTQRVFVRADTFQDSPGLVGVSPI